MQVVGRYQLLSEVARGGMGAIHRARAPDGQVVALKLLLAGRGASPILRRRMGTEIQALLRLRHPNVVALLDAGEHEGVPYLVMEWIGGESLAARLKRQGPLDPRDAVELVRRLAEALEYCHAQGVLHRDLKPDNVLLRSTDGEPLLVDFGISKDVLGESQTTVLDTIAGRWLGTPGWWPPEQARGEIDRLGPRSDVYGLGALLYGALTGSPPQAAGETIQELFRALERPPRPPGAHRGGVPAWLDAVCLRALAKDPDRRPASPAALAGELAAGGSPAGVRPGGRAAPLAVVLAVLIVGAGASIARSARLGPSGKERVSPLDTPVGLDTGSRPRKEPYLLWRWLPGQERRVALRLESRSSYDASRVPPQEGAARWSSKWEVKQRRRYAGVLRAEAIADGRVALRFTLEELSAFRSGPRSAMRAGDLDQDSTRGDPIGSAVGSALELRLDLRTGDVDQVRGVEAIASQLARADVDHQVAPELKSGAAFEEVLDHLMLLLPPGGEDPGAQSRWTVRRTWKAVPRQLDPQQVDLEVDARRPEAGGWMLRTRADVRGTASRLRVELLGQLEGQARLGPLGLELSLGRETWRGPGLAVDEEAELRVFEPR